MRIAKHICYFYNKERIKFINRIIDETATYIYNTDIFIHTNNKELNISLFNEYHNGSIQMVVHDLSGIHPYKLSWKCRDLLYKQKDEYDIFMYIEDDILVPKSALLYWIENNEQLTGFGYNLGFLRIELFENREYITDLSDKKFNAFLDLEGKTYAINNINPYCAFWIYNKDEFNRFVNSHYYSIPSIDGYYIRESSAIGLHGLSTPWYKATLIPMDNNKLINSCKIYHMSNNFVNKGPNTFGSIEFNDCIEIKHV